MVTIVRARAHTVNREPRAMCTPEVAQAAAQLVTPVPSVKTVSVAL